jgi:cyclase
MRVSKTAFLLILFGVAGPLTAAQNAPPAAGSLPFTLKSLGHGVYAAIDDAKGDSGANAGFVIGDDGVAVIDTFEHEAAAMALLAEIRKLTPLPIKFVVNTHYHLDHVAGNRIFKEAGATIIAQRNVGTWIHTENLKFFGKNIKPEQKAEVEGFVVPDVLYETGLDLRLGSRRVEVRFYPGHTGGDSVVHIPDAGVTFCGDLFWRKTLPNLIDATTSAWTSTLSTLAAAGEKETFVPGHGDVGDEADVQAFRGYLADLRAWVAPQVSQGKSGDELVASVLPELTKKYGDWDFFKYFAKRNIPDMAAELRGDKKIPEPSKK